MSDPIDTTLDNCGCCQPDPVPAPIYNRPGLTALAYRAGNHATFLRQMLNRMGRYVLPDGDFAGTRPLAALTTRSADDPAMALLDAGAMVADILTFYQERIANEGFLRTATERRSLLDLARAIGYELNPGVAAAAYLAFTVEDAPGAPGRAEIPAGTRVQSVPPQDEKPQTFETSAAIVARAEWNALRPRLTYPQTVDASTRKVYLQGTAANLKIGDHLVIDAGGTQQAFVQVLQVEVESDHDRTRVDFAVGASVAAYAQPAGLPQGVVDTDHNILLTATSVGTSIVNCRWTDDALNAFLAFHRWDEEQLQESLSELRQSVSLQGHVYALRTEVGIFGHNAPRYDSLPNRPPEYTLHVNTGQNWDGGFSIWKNQQTGNHYADHDGADIFLERVVPGLIPDSGAYPKSWAVLRAPNKSPLFCRISAVVERSLAGFALSGKVTGLTLKSPSWDSVVKSGVAKPAAIVISGPSDFHVRTTTACVQSEPLPLAESPMSEDLDSDPATLELDGLVLGLKAGQPVILTGERKDAPGITTSEVLIIKEVNHIAGFTTLTFETGRSHPYLRSTVTLNANVACATHGETVTEILGNGDGTLTNQRFTLKKPPLTYTAAATPSGSASTVELRVNNLLWEERPSLFGLEGEDQGYVIRLDDGAKATVTFGDAEHGARLPTGTNNVVASYRSGIGLEGEVAADSLTILQTRPLGIRGVTNPLPASGAGDPEKMDHARQNAPLTVRTLDRVVSRDDYEDFARAFAGIGKAQAVDLWSDGSHLVYLTVAGADGKPITDAAFLENFLDALAGVRDPAQQVKVGTFDLRLFNLTANIAVDKRYRREDVFAEVRAALAAAFAFDKRSFGRPVTAAEVIATIQNVDGVAFVDLDSLYLANQAEELNQILRAGAAYVKPAPLPDEIVDGQVWEPIRRAELVLINPLGVALRGVAQ
jgi:hypothetical protein